MSQFAPPKTIRAVFLLTCFKIVLAWTFFAVLKSRGTGPIDPTITMYTALGYMAVAVPTFILIHKHSALGVRVCIVLALLVGLPARAYLALGIDAIALALTFTAPAKRFFGAS